MRCMFVALTHDAFFFHLLAAIYPLSQRIDSGPESKGAVFWVIMIATILHIVAELVWLNAMIMRWAIQAFVEDYVLPKFSKTKKGIPKSMEEVLQPANLSFLMQYPKQKDRSYCRTTAGRCCRRWCTRYSEGMDRGFFADGTSQRLFVKLHPSDIMIRSFINTIGLYDNENFFFHNIATTIPPHLSVLTHCSKKVEVDVCTSKKTCTIQAIHFYRWSTLVTTKRFVQEFASTGGAALRPLGCPILGVEGRKSAVIY